MLSTFDKKYSQEQNKNVEKKGA